MSYRSTIQHFVKHAACKSCIRKGWLFWSNSMFPQSFLTRFWFFCFFYTKEVWTLLLFVLMANNNSILMVSSRKVFFLKITVILEMYVTMHSIMTTIYICLTTCNKMCLTYQLGLWPEVVPECLPVVCGKPGLCDSVCSRGQPGVLL